jgi:hypothetical protein
MRKSNYDFKCILLLDVMAVNLSCSTTSLSYVDFIVGYYNRELHLLDNSRRLSGFYYVTSWSKI